MKTKHTNEIKAELKSFEVWHEADQYYLSLMGKVATKEAYNRISEARKSLQQSYNTKVGASMRGKWCLRHDIAITDGKCPICEDIRNSE